MLVGDSALCLGILVPGFFLWEDLGFWDLVKRVPLFLLMLLKRLRGFSGRSDYVFFFFGISFSSFPSGLYS